MKKLYWTKKGDDYLLKNDEEVLLSLFFKLSGTSSFIINNKEYIISKKGFWNPGYFIKHNEEYILKLTHHFWGSNGKIVFNDGTEYTTDYKTRGGLKLRLTEEDREILAYKTQFVNSRPVMNFQVSENMLDADKLLIMAALGMTIYTTIFGEDGTSDADTATFLLMVS